MNTLRNLFYVVIGAALAIFIYFNFDQRVVIYFTRSWHTQEIPLALALFGALVVGFLVAAVLAVADQLRLRSRLRQMRRTIEQLESHGGGLRSSPNDASVPSPTSEGTEAGRESETGPETL